MNERFASIINKAKEITKNISPKIKKIIIVGVIISIALSIGIAVWLNNRPYEALFTGLNNQEASEIIGKLQEDGVAYQYESLSDGGTIYVPQQQAQQLRAELVYQGYPQSGFTYDVILNNIDLTTSESEKEQYILMDLQERMGATISLFPNVREARVTIAPGEDRRYVLDNDNATQATASATIITRDGNPISEEEVRAIQRLISRSSPQMEFADVAVICNGVDVTVDEESFTQNNVNRLKLELEEAIDDKIEGKIIDILAPIYGLEHVQVSVNSSVDVNRKIRELVDYSSENEDNTGVRSSETAHQEVERANDGAGGVVGAETNADIPVYTRIAEDGTETYILSDGTVDYLVDQVKEQQEINAADLQDLNVAVIIDTDNLSAATRDNLITLVARAAGISEEEKNQKIELMGIPFYTEQEPTVNEILTEPATDEQRRTQLAIIGSIAAAGLLLLILILVLLIKRIRNKRKANKQAMDVRPVYGAYDDNSGESMARAKAANDESINELINIKNEKSLELKNKIRELTEENPEISAQTLKSWLRGGNKGGE